MPTKRREKLNIVKYKDPSSPEKRAAARARGDGLRQRKKEVDAEMQSLKGWPQKLAEAARFCVDVNGDEPSMSNLRSAVEKAEKHEELRLLSDDLRKAINEATHEAMHYQWHAGRFASAGGVGFNIVLAEADSRKELDEKVKKKLAEERS